MTRKEALAELIKKTEAGELHKDRHILTGMYKHLGGFDGPWRDAQARSAYNGSLDAAKALHEAVLPLAWADVRYTGKYGHATVDVDGEVYEANNAPNPARAWLLAILRALYAQETG